MKTHRMARIKVNVFLILREFPSLFNRQPSLPLRIDANDYDFLVGIVYGLFYHGESNKHFVV